MSDDAKRLILARRARFVATAMAGLAVSACDSCDSKRGTTTETPTTQSTSTGPAACLKPAACLSPPRQQSNPDADDAAAAILRSLTALADDAAPTPLGEVATTTSVTGAVPRVEATVRAGFFARAQMCYRRMLAAEPNMVGRAVLSLQVTPSGDVDSASVTSSTGLSQSLTACVLNAARGLHFEAAPPTDASSAGTVTITATFSLPK